MINLIAAIGEEGQIGYKGRIPWIGDPRIANVAMADMAWFGRQTGGGVLIVGGRTYREMLRMGFKAGMRKVFIYEGEDPRPLIDEVDGQDVWICGGEHTYRKFMPFVQRFYISRIPWNGRADAYLPPLFPEPQR